MKIQAGFLCLLFLLTLFNAPSEAWRKWEYVQPSDIDITIRPDKPEVVSGEIATFTITIRNKTDKPVSVYFPTGQRWDMAAYHDEVQIWRWSQGLRWEEAPHSIDIRPGFPESYKLAWRTVDRGNSPIPHGLYRVQGMVMTKPRYLVSNMSEIHLLPPRHPNAGVIRVKLDQIFKIEVPRYEGYLEIDWQPQYVYNDNRISMIQIQRVGNKIIHYFKATRRGHVVVHMHGFFPEKEQIRSLERRTYRIEIAD